MLQGLAMAMPRDNVQPTATQISHRKFGAMRSTPPLWVAVVFAFCFAACASLTAFARESPIELLKVPDPGGPPPLVASDYKPYAKLGTATLTVPAMVKRKDGSFLGCEPNVGDALLYPSTPYVRWVLQKWAYLKQNGRFKANAEESRPGPYGGFDLPDYLIPGSSNSVVHYVACDANHNVTFRNLPAGDYIAWGNVYSRTPGSGSETHSMANLDPLTGVVTIDSITVPMNNDIVHDNYFYFSAIVHVNDDRDDTMHQDSIKPFAYER